MGWDLTASKLTFIPHGLIQHLVTQGLVLRNILCRGILTDLAKVVLGVAPEGIKVRHAHGFFDGSDIDRRHRVCGGNPAR